MEKLNLLEEKLSLLINQKEKLSSLNKINIEELKLLRTENIRAKKLIQDNTALRKKQLTIKTKLSQVLNKFNKLGV